MAPGREVNRMSVRIALIISAVAISVVTLWVATVVVKTIAACFQ